MEMDVGILLALFGALGLWRLWVAFLWEVI